MKNSFDGEVIQGQARRGTSIVEADFEVPRANFLDIYLVFDRSVHTSIQQARHACIIVHLIASCVSSSMS